MSFAARRWLVRPWAWWFNKVPLSVTLLLLLLDGGPLSLGALAALVLVVLTVCAVGNFGYALNDLFDVQEDRRTGRPNAANATSSRQTACIAAGSAALALVLATMAAGVGGGLLTVIELALPLTYSAPPVRTKERKWLGIASDALAAHVYPAVLALLAVGHLGAAHPSRLVVAAVLAWSLAAGVRGILSHQLHTADRDVRGGLRTVVHDLGRTRLERLVVFVLIPIEATGFIVTIAASRTGPVLWAFGALFLICEAHRTWNPGFTVQALRREGQRYLPLVEESFYKAWGPLVIALDAARVDLTFLLVAALYAVLFRMHLRIEAGRLRQLIDQLLRRPARS